MEKLTYEILTDREKIEYNRKRDHIEETKRKHEKYEKKVLAKADRPTLSNPGGASLFSLARLGVNGASDWLADRGLKQLLDTFAATHSCQGIDEQSFDNAYRDRIKRLYT